MKKKIVSFFLFFFIIVYSLPYASDAQVSPVKIFPVSSGSIEINVPQDAKIEKTSENELIKLSFNDGTFIFVLMELSGRSDDKADAKAALKAWEKDNFGPQSIYYNKIFEKDINIYNEKAVMAEYNASFFKKEFISEILFIVKEGQLFIFYMLGSREPLGETLRLFNEVLSGIKFTKNVSSKPS